MGDLQLQEEELQHYFTRAQDLLGKTEITAEEYADLAGQSAAQERYLAAAYYYHLAESQALPAPSADLYKQKPREMMAKAEGRG